MNALRIVLIVAALAIFGCAGVTKSSRFCIEDAVNRNQTKSEELDRKHSEPRVTDSCEKVKAVVSDGVETEIGDFAYFRCHTADPIDDEDYAHLLDMYMRSLRIQIESCL